MRIAVAKKRKAPPASELPPRFDPQGFSWQGKAVSQMDGDELRQALCRAISDLYGVEDVVKGYRKQFPIYGGYSETLRAPNHYHGPHGEACQWLKWGPSW